MTFNPGIISKGPTSSMRLPFGLYFPCPQGHGYCFGCLKSYLQSKLAEGKAGTLVFPIRCPECPIDAWSFSDEVAAKVLDSADMVQWVRVGTTERKGDVHRDDSIPKSYSTPSLAFTARISFALFVLKSTTAARKRWVRVRPVPSKYASVARRRGTEVGRAVVSCY
jgi:hypothetical protein